MMERLWREESAHMAELIYPVLNSWSDSTLSALYKTMPKGPRIPWEPLGEWWIRFHDALLSNIDFFRWANAHIIHPLDAVNPLSKNAPAEVQIICRRLKRLAECLKSGGNGSALVWEVADDSAQLNPKPKVRGGRQPGISPALDAVLKSEVRCPPRADQPLKRPTLDNWAQSLVLVLKARKGVASKSSSIRNLLKGRWAFDLASRSGSDWVCTPQQLGDRKGRVRD